MAEAQLLVPVDTLKIDEFPELATLGPYRSMGWCWGRNLSASLTLRTPASSKTFTRQAIFWEIRVTHPDFIEDGKLAQFVPDEDPTYAQFNCILAGQQFTGYWDYKTKKGELHAYTYEEAQCFDYRPNLDLVQQDANPS